MKPTVITATATVIKKLNTFGQKTRFLLVMLLCWWLNVLIRRCLNFCFHQTYEDTIISFRSGFNNQDVLAVLVIAVLSWQSGHCLGPSPTYLGLPQWFIRELWCILWHSVSVCQRPHHWGWVTQFTSGRCNFLSSVCVWHTHTQTHSESVLTDATKCPYCSANPPTPPNQHPCYTVMKFILTWLLQDFWPSGSLIARPRHKTTGSASPTHPCLLWAKSGQLVLNNIMTESQNRIQSQLAARKCQAHSPRISSSKWILSTSFFWVSVVSLVSIIKYYQTKMIFDPVIQQSFILAKSLMYVFI